MTKYFAATGAPLSDSEAQQYGEFIDEICKKDGAVQPETLVENMNHPSIKDWFNETDEEAAYKWRVDKARHLLQYIHVEIEGPDGKTYRDRAFYPVTIEVNDTPESREITKHRRRAYRPTLQILEIPEQREEVFQDVLKRFREMRERYRDFKQLKEVFDAIDRL